MSTRRPLVRGVDLLLQPERVEAALWRIDSDGSDESAARRIRLFEHYRPLALRLARAQFARRRADGFDRADVEQLAYEGLLQTIDRFDAQRGVPFEGYARIRINGHIANGLVQASEGTAQSSHRRRTERERLKSLRPSVDANPILALSALSASIALGLLLEANARRDMREVPDPGPSAYDSLVWNEMHEKVRESVGTLPEREGFVIRQHYLNGVGFQQIALLLGVTKGRISQLHRAGLERLRAILAKSR